MIFNIFVKYLEFLIKDAKFANTLKKKKCKIMFEAANISNLNFKLMFILFKKSFIL